MSDQFNFKYSAPTEAERKEIDSIRRQYAPSNQSETKIERLRRLDSLVKNSAIIWALCLGIIGTLIFGLGLTMILEWNIWLWGILLGTVGSIPMLIAYPVYKWVLDKNKKRYGEEILKLSEELLNETAKDE
ncbi:MAG: dihydropteridine reductase [Clostridia bacterium]|nr:dihydropteridine reductase [Clostridia bacterium]